MISLSMALADPDGTLVIKEKPSSIYRAGVGRVTRTANLDGSTTINHGGVEDGDRTFKIYSNLNLQDTDRLWYIFKNSTLITICTSEGAYRGAIDYLEVDGGNLNMTILIKERIST